MMKVAIITFFDNGNYGSELQALAMNYYLKAEGHIAVFCKVKSSNKMVRAVELLYDKALLKWYKLTDNEKRQYLIDRSKNLSLQRNITHQLKQHIHTFVEAHISLRSISRLSIFRNERFDAYICGSDQIWSALKIPLLPLNFLYGIDKKIKIAYAPSIGLDNPPLYFIKQVEKYIRDFIYLSVREEAAKSVVQKYYGIDAKQVLDPTLLQGKEFWDSLLTIESKQMPAIPYVFCYFLGNLNEDVVSCINRISNGRQVIMLPYAEDCNFIKNGKYELADPLDFVNLIKHADCILTDSFHGSIFSILYDKQFVVTKRSHVRRVSQTSRITSLLNMFNLQNQYCSVVGEMINAIQNNIDYTFTHSKLEEERRKSRYFLDNSLNEIEKHIKS